MQESMDQRVEAFSSEIGDTGPIAVEGRKNSMEPEWVFLQRTQGLLKHPKEL